MATKSKRKTLKRLFILTVSFIYYFFRQVTILFFKKEKRAKPVVLLYHGVSQSQQADFRKQLQWIKAVAQPISVDAISSANERKNVVITFDDAFQNLIDNAIPFLEKYAIPAVIFVPAGKFGYKPDWSRAGQDEKVMTISQIRQLPQDIITIGSHSFTHPPLTQISLSQLYEECFRSKSHLQKILSREIKYFAFPFGEFGQRELKIAGQAGYKRVFAAWPLNGQGSEFLCDRIEVSPDDWEMEFRLKVKGAYKWLGPLIHFKATLKSMIALVVCIHAGFQLSMLEWIFQ